MAQWVSTFGPMDENLTAADARCAPDSCPERGRHPHTAAVDFTFLKTFVGDIVAEHFTAEEKRKVCGQGVCIAELVLVIRWHAWQTSCWLQSLMARVLRW